MDANTRQKLFNYLYGEYGISLMNSDFNEIEHILALQSSEWVKVEDRFPEGDGYYLIYGCHSKGCPKNVFEALFIKHRGKRYFTANGIKSKEVTHWMPLPTPPNR